jgi:hypothetical protein
VTVLSESVIRLELGPVTVILYDTVQVVLPLVVEFKLKDLVAPKTKIDIPELNDDTSISVT